MIKKNILGKTGIEVSVIGFGGAPWVIYLKILMIKFAMIH